MTSLKSIFTSTHLSAYPTIKRLTMHYAKIFLYYAQIAQLVEQRTENPCVGGSIPPLGTILTEKNIEIIRESPEFPSRLIFQL